MSVRSKAAAARAWAMFDGRDVAIVRVGRGYTTGIGKSFNEQHSPPFTKILESHAGYATG